MSRLKHSLLVACVATTALFAGATTAQADDHIHERFAMPGGQILVRGMFEVNLSKDAAFKPVSIAPDGYFGITDDLTVGLVHSQYGMTGFLGGTGASLCITGGDNGCGRVYDSVGAAVRYHLLDGPITLAADGGIQIGSFDPFQLRIKAGVVGAWRSGKLSVVFNPSLLAGLSNRDAGNKEVLLIPASVMYAVTDKLNAGLQTGVILPFAAVDELWQLPLTLGAQMAVSDGIAVVGAFSLTALAGGELVPTGLDGRSLTLGIEVGF